MKHISGEAIALLDAMKEKRVSKRQLAEEIKPLFDEYFFGVTACGDGTIYYHLPNGQIFKLSVNEVGGTETFMSAIR